MVSHAHSVTSDNIPFWGRHAHSRAEVIADGVVHAVGLVAAVSAGSILLAFAAFHAGPGEYVAALFFVLSLLTLLATSLAYNLWPVSRTKWLLRRLDHCAIYLLIAATYTPFLVQLDDPWLAGGMAALVWTAALIGMAVKIFLPGRFDRLAIVFYLVIGWSGIFVARSVLATLPASTVWLIAAGGVAYSSGVVFFVWQRLRFQSAAWHGFVIVGAGLHLAAVMDCLVITRA